MAIVFCVYVFMLWFYTPFATQSTRYFFKSIQNPNVLVTESFQLTVPDRWMIDEILDDGAVLLSNVPYIREEETLVIMVFDDNPDKICERVYAGNWKGEACDNLTNGPYEFTRTSESKLEHRVDLLWVFPSKGVMAIAGDYNAETSPRFFKVVNSIEFY